MIYINSTARYVLNSSPIYVIDYPINITPRYQIEYYVTIILPNSTELNYWIIRGGSISVPKIVNVSPTTIALLVGKGTYSIFYPQSIRPNYTYKYLVTIYLPNGQIIKEFALNGTNVSYPSIIYVKKGERFIIVGSKTTRITSPMIITPKYLLQYYFTIVLPNGTIIEGWYDNGSEISISNTIYLSKYVKLVLISPSPTIRVNESITIFPRYEPYYYVSIKYINGSTINGWYKNESTIRLLGKEHFYYEVFWNGAYNLTNNQIIKVFEPIFEVETRILNIYMVTAGALGIATIILVAILVVIIAKHRRESIPKSPVIKGTPPAGTPESPQQSGNQENPKQ